MPRQSLLSRLYPVLFLSLTHSCSLSVFFLNETTVQRVIVLHPKHGTSSNTGSCADVITNLSTSRETMDSISCAVGPSELTRPMLLLVVPSVFKIGCSTNDSPSWTNTF